MRFIPYQSKYLQDLFTDKTFAYRKSTNLISLLLILIIELNIVPTKITTLGIELSSTDQTVLLFLLFAINLYQILSFGVFSVSDYWKFKVEINASALKYFFAQLLWLDERNKEMESIYSEIEDIPDSTVIQEKINELDNLLSDFEERQNPSQFVSDVEARWEEIKSKRAEINKLFKKVSENQELRKELKDKFEESQKYYDKVLSYEEDFFTKNISKISKVKWFYFAVIPCLLFIYSTYLVFTFSTKAG